MFSPPDAPSPASSSLISMLTYFSGFIFFLPCFFAVVGDKERESGAVNVRSRGGKQLGSRQTEEVLRSLIHLRDTRSNQDEF